MENLLFTIVVFIIIYLAYLFTVIMRPEKLKIFVTAKEITLLKSRYKLNIDQIDVKKLAHTIAISNSFIISFTIYMALLVDNMVLQLLIGFLVMIPSILIVYYIIGRHYKRKEVKNNV